LTGDNLLKELETDRPSRSVSPYKAGIKSVCPRCGKAPLFHNILEVYETCPGCGFDLSSADPGDGAQVFVILVLGGLCALLGFILYGLAGMPIWALAGTLGVFALVGSLVLLRIFKATLIALQFHHDARQGLIDDCETKP